MSITGPDRQAALLGHPLPWTEEEFLALPETVWPRVELLDGALMVTPSSTASHQVATRRLANLMESAGWDGWAATGINLRLGPGRILIPDVVLTRETHHGLVFGAAHVALAAEVMSAASAEIDRLLKPTFYAGAGIAWYLRVDLQATNAPEVVAYRLKDGTYVEHVRAHAGQELRLKEPVEVAFDPATLLDVW